MSDNLDKLREMERRAEPVVDSALDRLKESKRTGCILVMASVLFLVLVAFVSCGN